MPESSSVQPILDAADQAATAGDIGAARELLQQAVQEQETNLGPHHPDLANTLNNLGVACEKTGRLDQAEACYRRACEIAAAAFQPDHPFAITSRRNLADFCEARGKAIDPPAAAKPAPSSSQPPPVSPRVDPGTGNDVGPAPKPSGFRITTSSPLTIALIVVLMLGVVAIMRPSGPAEPTSPAPTPAAQTPGGSPTDREPAASSAAPAAADSNGPARETAPRSTTPGGRSVPGKNVARAGSTRTAAKPVVAEARVCRRFSTAVSPNWRCEQAGSPVARGSLVYYTRVKAPRATTVEHRWYHGDDLQQKVVLDVAANPGAGYRTYSRLAVSAPGRWHVELRAADGTVLHEERFTVR